MDTTPTESNNRLIEKSKNLYVHFPFCRRKCTYCILHSRAGTSAADRAAYVARVAEALTWGGDALVPATLYFGGGSPALCDLTPLGPALHSPIPQFANSPISPPEFTVELHPLDVTREKLAELKSIGVNRISMGVQSLDDDILRHMGRGYTFAEAERAFYLVKEYFDNAGIDLIVGYPGEKTALTPRHARLAKWGLKHCSVYSLQWEEGSILAKMRGRAAAPRPPHPTGESGGHGVTALPSPGPVPAVDVPNDETVLNRISIVARFLKDIGLERYEISNYAVPGYECRHNLATWRGEDYLGIGDGACGRIGLTRTLDGKIIETVTAERDAVERRIFSLRTKWGLDTTGFPEWVSVLERFVGEGLLVREAQRYRLTERGTEVCDSILAELV